MTEKVAPRPDFDAAAEKAAAAAQTLEERRAAVRPLHPPYKSIPELMYPCGSNA